MYQSVLTQVIPLTVCTCLYLYVLLWYKAVQGGTRRYQAVPRRYKEVPSGTKTVVNSTDRYILVRTGVTLRSTDRYVLLCSDLFAAPGFAFLLDSLLQCCPAGSSVFEINASTSTIMIYLTLGPVCPSALGSFAPFALGERLRRRALAGSRGGFRRGGRGRRLRPSSAAQMPSAPSGACAVLASNLQVKGLATGQPPTPAFFRMLVER
jgi:hypothetical protein